MYIKKMIGGHKRSRVVVEEYLGESEMHIGVALLKRRHHAEGNHPALLPYLSQSLWTPVKKIISTRVRFFFYLYMQLLFVLSLRVDGVSLWLC